MFRRFWSGLPKDATFPSDLKGLGYFINGEDEIRSIENPDYYFKFFLNKNERINDRQRFEFNGAMEKIIFERLEKEGLDKVTLPLGTSPTKPHAPIFVSRDLTQKSRIVVILGEPTQDLGMLAGRVANGPGGVNKGSMVSVVKALKAQSTSITDLASPGIVIANMGQRYWWPEGNRAITLVATGAIPMPSMVHVGRKYIPSVNDIPGSESPLKHVESIFQDVLANLAPHDAKIDVIAIGDSCEVFEKFLDDAKNWETWGPRLNAAVLLGSCYTENKLRNIDLKEFLAKRACGFITSDDPLNTPLASPMGNPALGIQGLGTPTFSSGEPWYAEMIFIKAFEPILEYLQEVALADDFENPTIEVIERPPVQEFTEEDWEKVPEEDKPEITPLDYEALREELRQQRLWRKFERTGLAPNSDDEEEELEVEDAVKLVVRKEDWNTW